MKLAFWKKQIEPIEEVKQEKILILPEHQMELRQLWDKYEDSEENEQANSYAFWYTTSKYYPQIKIGVWAINWYGLKGFLVKEGEEAGG